MAERADGTERERPAAPLQRVPVRTSRAWLDGLDWRWTSGRRLAVDFEFTVRSTDPAFGPWFERVLAPFAAAGEPSARAATFSLVDRGRGHRWRWVIYRGTRRLASNPEPWLPVAFLLHQLNESVVGTARRALVLHASAAVAGDGALVFPAPPESGKTTLVAGLVRAGLRYLTDEAVVVDCATTTIRPFPKALSVDAGSWPVLADLEPAADPAFGEAFWPQWQVPAVSIRPDALSGPCPPRYVILPRYQAGARTELVPLRRAEAVAALASNSFNFERLGRSGFETAVAVVRRSRCHRLVVGDLSAACDLVLDLISTERHEGAA